MKTALMAFLSLAVCLVAGPVLAGEATIAKTHICCGGCVSAIEETLGKVEGLTDITVDKEAKTISYQADDAKTARKGVRALTRAGFGGEAKFNNKEVKLVAPKIEKDAKADEVKLTRVHMCCGACIKAIEGAVGKVDGVASVTCDKEKGTCTATGKDVKVMSVLQALQKAGFHGTVPGQNKKEGAKKEKAAAAS